MDIARHGMVVMGLLAATEVSGLTVSSVEELALAVATSGQHITMVPGVYQMEDYLTPAVIDQTTPDSANRYAMVTFSGSNNTVDCTGVTIEVNTALLNDFGGRVIEFYVAGDNNLIKGLTVTDIGMSPTASGGQSLTISGDHVTIEDVTLNMSGSSPYGYGDLLGKGSSNLVPMRKHSGLLVEGLDVRVTGCSIYSRSFGHCFFVQGGRDVYFENCHAEAITRTTDDMLAETSGPAFNLGFASVYRNYDGDKVITPGYTKSLSECGFRTYGSGGLDGHVTGAITLVNCSAKNTRIGFALTETNGDILVKDCVAIGCEAGYNVDGVTIEGSRGDAVNGPLLYLNGGASNVELYLVPNVATTIVHAVATIAGDDHVVTLKKWENSVRAQVHSILLGATRPAGSNPFSPLGTTGTSGVTLNNYTEMPVDVGSTVNSSTIVSHGAVTDDGSGNSVSPVRDPPTPVGQWSFDDGAGAVAADSSGFGHHGMVENAAWVAGSHGGGLDFNGTNSRVTVPAAAFDSIGSEITIAMWAYGGDLQPQSDTAFYAQDSSSNRLLNVHLPWGDSNVYWDAGYSAGYDRVSKLAVEAEVKGRWNHWVFTKNAIAGTMTIYLNGARWHSGTRKTRTLTGISAATIGAQIAARSYDGAIDNVRLYDLALTDQEVEALFHLHTGEFASRQDIGSVSLAGHALYSNGRYTVAGSGSDIDGTADVFYFLSNPHAGDGEFVTQVESVQDTHAAAKAGLMFRESTAPGAKNVLLALHPGKLVTMQSRSSTDGPTTSYGTFGNTTDAKWLKLVRTDDRFTGYYSVDGRSWRQVASVTVSMSREGLQGLAVTSHSDADLCTATFNQVPPSPVGIAAEAVDATQIDVNWDPSTSATAYNLLRSLDHGGPYATIAAAHTSTHYRDTGLSAGTRYHYVVSAEYHGVDGGRSIEVEAVPSAVLDPDGLVLNTGSVGTNGVGQTFSVTLLNSGLGHTYRLQRTDRLVNPAWEEAADAMAGTGGKLSIEILLQEPQTNQFFRLAAERQ